MCVCISIYLSIYLQNTNIDVSNYGLFVEPIEFFQFFIIWSCFQLPHIFCDSIKISLEQKEEKVNGAFSNFQQARLFWGYLPPNSGNSKRKFSNGTITGLVTRIILIYFNLWIPLLVLT